MSCFERFDTWILIGIALFLVIGFLIDGHEKNKRLKKAMAKDKKIIAQQREQIVRLMEENAQEIKRREAAVSHTINLWTAEREVLKAEIAKKDKLLNQKWKGASK